MLLALVGLHCPDPQTGQRQVRRTFPASGDGNAPPAHR